MHGAATKKNFFKFAFTSLKASFRNSTFTRHEESMLAVNSAGENREVNLRRAFVKLLSMTKKIFFTGVQLGVLNTPNTINIENMTHVGLEILV